LIEVKAVFDRRSHHAVEGNLKQGHGSVEMNANVGVIDRTGRAITGLLLIA